MRDCSRYFGARKMVEVNGQMINVPPVSHVPACPFPMEQGMPDLRPTLRLLSEYVKQAWYQGRYNIDDSVGLARS